MFKKYLEYIFNEAPTIDQFYVKNEGNKPDKIDKNVFTQIVKLDPTSFEKKIGNYTSWLVTLYRKLSDNGKKKMLGEDGSKYTSSLKLYDQAKRKKSLNLVTGAKRDLFTAFPPKLGEKAQIELYKFVSNFKSLESEIKGKQETIKDDVEKVVGEGSWAVYIPKTFKASCTLGTKTNWCTASDNETGKEYYNKYTKKGPLYVIINNATKEKWQFHFDLKNPSEDLFTDSSDEELKIPIWILANKVPKKIIDYFNKKDTKKRFIDINSVTPQKKTKAILDIYDVNGYDLNKDTSVNISGGMTL